MVSPVKFLKNFSRLAVIFKESDVTERRRHEKRKWRLFGVCVVCLYVL